MTLKNIIQDMREGVGSISMKRSFEARIHRSRSHQERSFGFGVLQQQQHHQHNHNHNHHHHHHQQQQQKNNVVCSSEGFQCVWANLPPELLRDVVKRIEESEREWPNRRSVVACAGVCRAWRHVTKELVRSPAVDGQLTFPSSLKQPGSKGSPVQCFIKRDRATSTYKLFLSLGPALADHGKLLLAAQRFRRATSTEYVISLDPKDMSRDSNAYVGKLRSNFLASKFNIYDSQPPRTGVAVSTNHNVRRVGTKQIFPKVPTGSYNIAHIGYELNVLGARGPRRMQCVMHSIPASAAHGDSFISVLDNEALLCGQTSSFRSCPSVASSRLYDGMPLTETLSVGNLKEEPLVLKNKAPRWHEQLQCWCLNFRGRVTVASVKNFQLVSASESNGTVPQNDHESCILQFGKVGKDMFTMDYCYPLSAFQAFAICLSSFDTKLACE